MFEAEGLVQQLLQLKISAILYKKSLEENTILMASKGGESRESVGLNSIEWWHRRRHPLLLQQPLNLMYSSNQVELMRINQPRTSLTLQNEVSAWLDFCVLKYTHSIPMIGKAGWIRNLLDRTVEFDVNGTDNLLRTPLHWAAEMGHIEAAEALLDYGCEVAKKECNGRTAVHLAARSADAEMLKTLMEGIDSEERKRLANETGAFCFHKSYGLLTNSWLHISAALA